MARRAEPVTSVDHLIDHQRRRARLLIRSAGAARWEIAQVWSYTRVYCRADIFAYLDDAATARRLLADLLSLRCAGMEYLPWSRWKAMESTAGQS